MKGIHRSGFIHNAATLTVLSFLLSACLMDEEAAESGGDVATDNEVSGSVGDGPIVGASMRILRNDGVELAQLESDANAGYNIMVRTKGKYYPLSIEARNGTDLVTNTVPDFELLGAVLEPGKKSVANINPFSTFAVELSRDLAGGIDKTNLGTAQEIVTSEFNYGLSSLASSGVMATRIDGSNIAEIVRASEALGETIRRTRDALGASGFSTSGNNVVRALSSDLTDTVIDGNGGPRADARIAAVAVIVSAQVLLETMANELHVNGADATQVMSNAINQVSLEIADPGLEDLTVTANMLARIRIGIVAAHTISSDSAIADLLTAIEGVQTGWGSSTIRTFALPSDYRNRLDNAVLLAAGGSTAVVTTVNDISRDGSQTISGAGVENRAPSISGTPPGSVDIGSAYSFTPTASDPDNDPVSFTVSGLPSWASFNTATGQLSGTPGAAAVHTGIIISVSDGTLSASLPAFSIAVTAVATNSPPTIGGSPATQVNAGESYSFTPTASDPDNDPVSFTVSGLPSWASFDTATGQLSGTPGAAAVHTGIIISVSDGTLSASLPAFSIAVTAVATNSPPTIGGSPATQVNAGESYSFTPTASDPDSDTLTFTESGLPSWANFNTTTGQISGTPQSGDVGVYSDISITVSDGQASDTLGPFTITVQAISLGSVTLTWTAPTQNEDGSALTDLDCYKLYWGTTPGNYSNSIMIENASVTTYVVENLSPGNYEFVATSLNTSGVESRYSAPVTKVVP